MKCGQTPGSEARGGGVSSVILELAARMQGRMKLSIRHFAGTILIIVVKGNISVKVEKALYGQTI